MISGLWFMTYDFHSMILTLWFLLYGFGFIISCPTDKLKSHRIRIIKVEIVNLKSESLILKPKS